MSIDDSGVPTYCGTVEMQLQEAEERRLTYGAVSTRELKRREPKAFEPRFSVLFLQLVQAQRAGEFYKEVLPSIRPNDREFRTYVRYAILAHERATELVERKLLKKMQYLGFDKIDAEMMRLANETYDNMPKQLGSYLVKNSPMFRRLLGERWRTD